MNHQELENVARVNDFSALGGEDWFRLVVNAGVLINKDEFAQQIGDTRNTFLTFDYGDQVQPRLGANYQISKARGDKVYANYGRYYGSALPVAEDATIDDARACLETPPVQNEESCQQMVFSPATGICWIQTDDGAFTDVSDDPAATGEPTAAASPPTRGPSAAASPVAFSTSANGGGDECSMIPNTTAPKHRVTPTVASCRPYWHELTSPVIRSSASSST